MAAKDWVCGVCTAQNHSADSACRVCDAARAKAVAAPAEVPDGPRAKAPPVITPVRMRRLLLVMSLLWYAALTLTGLQWLTNLSLPALLGQPAAIPDSLRGFPSGGYSLALQTIGAELSAWLASGSPLSGFGQVLEYGLTTLTTAGVNPLALQCGVLTVLWGLRLFTASLAESQLHIRSRRNLMCFTILPADLLLAALALVPHTDAPWLALRVFLLSLLTPQLAAITAVTVLLLLIGACSRRSMTRCLLKCAAAAGLIWLCAALLPLA